MGCSPRGRWELGTTERLHFHFSLSCAGEGHGNPLRCSCLENPRDGGAWWAAVHGVAQTRTRLKRLSSSSRLCEKPHVLISMPVTWRFLISQWKCWSLSRVRLFATPWTVAHQALLSMGLSRQEYWSGLPFPSPGELPDPGIKPVSPELHTDSLPSEPSGKPFIISKSSQIKY